MRCLLVEDERQVMESMAEFVPWKELGFAAPLMAANGLEALKILETRNTPLYRQMAEHFGREHPGKRMTSKALLERLAGLARGG